MAYVFYSCNVWKKVGDRVSPLDRSLEEKYQTAVVFELLFIYAIGGYIFRSDTVPYRIY